MNMHPVALSFAFIPSLAIAAENNTSVGPTKFISSEWHGDDWAQYVFKAVGRQATGSRYEKR